MYGFHGDIHRRFYSLYCTNLHAVWLETMTPVQIHTRAKELGADSFDDDLLVDLIRNSAELFDQEGLVQCHKVGPNMVFTLIGLDWVFDLRPATDTETAEVLSMLNCQQFLNHRFLLYKIHGLEGLIQAKDQYIKYLTTNLESLDGGKSSQWYRKNHGTEAVQGYVRHFTSKRIESGYLARVRGKLGEISDYVWNYIDKTLADDLWRVTDELRALTLSMSVSSQIKQEIGLSSEVKQEPWDQLSLPVKKEPMHIKQESQSIEGLPLLKRKLDLSDQETTPDSSPRKRRIGALPKRKRTK